MRIPAVDLPGHRLLERVAIATTVPPITDAVPRLDLHHLWNPDILTRTLILRLSLSPPLTNIQTLTNIPPTIRNTIIDHTFPTHLLLTGYHRLTTLVIMIPHHHDSRTASTSSLPQMLYYKAYMAS